MDYDRIGMARVIIGQETLSVLNNRVANKILPINFKKLLIKNFLIPKCVIVFKCLEWDMVFWMGLGEYS